MLDRGVLSRLFVLTEKSNLTLTLYVDIDQNKQANRKGGHQVQAEALLKALASRHGSDTELEQAIAQAQNLVADIEPTGKTALVVVHPDSGFEEVHLIRLAFPASAHWRRGAYLRPIVEAMDENERYGVVLANQQRARIFTVYMGEITEHSDILSDTGQKARAIGTDQFRSDKRQQRHHEGQVALHAKRAVDALRELALRAPFDRLIVAGPIEAATQVARLLPRRMHGKLVETINMRVNASIGEVLERTLEVQRRLERDQEQTLMEGLVAELHEGGKAAAGLAPVVDAVNQGRVWKLFYTRGFDAAGSECRSCEVFSPAVNGSCSLCDETLHALPHFVDRLSQDVLETGGSVEVVAGDAADVLRKNGDIAVLMRY